MSTVLEYNGITLDMVRTVSINQEPIMSDDGIDYLWTRFQVHVQAIFNPALLPATTGDVTPAEIMMRVRSGLLTPRRKLLVNIDNNQGGIDTMIQSPRGNHFQDDANGPKPLYCNIQRIDGSQTFIVSYGVETYLNECFSNVQGEPGAPNAMNYVSNRWTETQTYDDRMYTHRYVTGKLVVRSEALVDPNSMRGVIYRDCPIGFERRSETYTVSSDNLVYTYNYHDVMVYKVTPQPAMRWEGTVLTANQEKSINAVTTECIIVMHGGAIYDPLGLNPPTFSSKASMLTQAAIIALGQLFPTQNPPFLPIPNQPNGVIMRCAVRNMLHENTIELRVATINQPFNQTLLGALPMVGNFNGDLEHVRGVDAAPLPPGAGYQKDGNDSEKGITFLTKVIDDPCVNLKRQTADDVLAEETQESGDGTQVATVLMNTIPAELNLINQYDTANGVYTFYSMTQNYKIDYHTVPLPLMSSYSNQTVSFAVLSPPTMTRVVKWEAERVGQPPTLPSPSLFDPINVLLFTTVEPQTPPTMGDLATLIWKLRGEYIYGLTGVMLSGGNPTWAGTAGTLPFLLTTPDKTNNWNFERGLIDNALT